MKTIRVTVSKTGATKVETEGFVGAECVAATARVEAALGKVGPRTEKPEMYATEAQRETERS